MNRSVPSHAPFAVSAAATVILFLVPSVAMAQGFAVRTGMNINPDQIAAGAQYEWPLSDHVWFQPNADLGIGNDAKLVTMNMDIVYRVPVAAKSSWMLFAGGGSGLNYYKMPGYNATLAGVNALGGVMHHSGLFVQATAGFLDSPRFKFGLGYAFHPTAPRPKRVPTR